MTATTPSSVSTPPAPAAPVRRIARTPQWLYGWLLLLPSAVLLVAFTHYPIVRTIYNSFFSTPRGRIPARFVGLENYQALLHDDIFLRVLGNNFLFALGTIPASVGLALLMAVWVNGTLPGRALARTSFFTPTVLPMVAVANIWLFFYTPQVGILEKLLAPFGIHGVNWLGDPSTVLWCLAVMAVWKEAGFFMIFYLAALQGVPPDLTEAARIEGAGRWYCFRRITWPLLMPTTIFVLLNATINCFKLVDHLFIMTKGGPDNASSLLLYYIYETAFAYWDTAYASTLTVVLLGLLALTALAQFLYLERRAHYR
jgi:sn-glycerol 3-phosphate transport system permease protein